MIGVAKAFEDADIRIYRVITSHKVKIYSVDNFNCSTRQNPMAPTRRGRQTEAITAARKARPIVTEELERNGWSKDPDKVEELNFGAQGEAKWVGITFIHDLSWKKHNNWRLNLAEATWACISRLGTSRGSLSPKAWRQVCTGSICAIATYGTHGSCYGETPENSKL